MTDMQGPLKPVKIYSFSFIVQNEQGTGHRTRYLIIEGDINMKIIEDRITHYRDEERQNSGDQSSEVFCLNVAFMSDAMMDVNGKLVYPKGVLLGSAPHVPFEVPVCAR